MKPEEVRLVAVALVDTLPGDGERGLKPERSESKAILGQTRSPVTGSEEIGRASCRERV